MKTLIVLFALFVIGNKLSCNCISINCVFELQPLARKVAQKLPRPLVAAVDVQPTRSCRDVFLARATAGNEAVSARNNVHRRESATAGKVIANRR